MIVPGSEELVEEELPIGFDLSNLDESENESRSYKMEMAIQIMNLLRLIPLVYTVCFLIYCDRVELHEMNFVSSGSSSKISFKNCILNKIKFFIIGVQNTEELKMFYKLAYNAFKKE